MWRKLKVLATSTNSHALTAFEEKLPPLLRKTCLNVARAVEGGMAELLSVLEGLDIDLREIKENADRYKDEIKVGALLNQVSVDFVDSPSSA